MLIIEKSTTFNCLKKKKNLPGPNCSEHENFRLKEHLTKITGNGAGYL